MMPHNRFFSHSSLEKGETIQLDEEESMHAVKVMRLSVGDELELVDGLGHLARAHISRCDKKAVVCEIKEVVEEKKTRLKYILAVGLLRHSSMELVCEKATELGAEALFIFPAIHSEKERISEHQMERLYKHRLSALKQCGRLFLPQICFFSSLEELLRANNYPLFFGDVDPDALPLKNVCSSECATFLVGPESGLDEKEEKLLLAHDAIGVSLHPHILRAETACIAACSQLSLLLD